MWPSQLLFFVQVRGSLCPSQLTVLVRHPSQLAPANLAGHFRVSGQSVSESADSLCRSQVVVCVLVSEQSGSESGGSRYPASESAGSLGLSQLAVCG